MANSVTDPLVVPAEALGRIMREWIVKHNAEHELAGRRRKDLLDGDHAQTTAYQYLAEWMEVDQRRIQQLARGGKGFVSLGVADRVLSVMGYNINHFPELGPVPNPLWSQARWLRWKSEQGGCENDGGIYEPPDDGAPSVFGGGEGEGP